MAAAEEGLGGGGGGRRAAVGVVDDDVHELRRQRRLIGDLYKKLEGLLCGVGVLCLFGSGHGRGIS